MMMRKFASASLLVLLAVINVPAFADSIEISGSPPTTAVVGQLYRFRPVVTNADTSKLEFDYINLPGFSRIYRSSGLIMGIPTEPGVYKNIQIGVGDGSRYVLLPPFTITVRAAGTGSTPSQPAGSLSWSAASYTASQGAGTVKVFVGRSGGTGAVTVNYATSNGTAAAGTNYTAESGTLSWPAGDANTKWFVIPLSTTAFSGSKSFSVALSQPTGGATLGTVATTTVTVDGTAANATQTVALSATSYTVTQSAGSVSIPVSRSGGTGAASVNYSTSNVTATAGQNYTAKSGTVSWSSGDTSVKSIVVPVSSTVISNPVKFSVALSQPSGATVGTPAAATVTINKASTSSSASSGGPSISVSGNKLIDAQGNEVQLRGVNVSGLEAVAISGWSPSNPWGNYTGTPTPNWDTIKSWGSNVVRLPLNEASWLGLTCVDVGGEGQTITNGVQTQNKPGTVIKADPGGNYQATLETSVAQATAAGLYVILDLHFAIPGNACPFLQNAMADADHSIDFWTSIATQFKSYPNVIFELFNEPFLDMTTALVDNTPWLDLLNGGGTLSYYVAQEPNSPWQKNVNYTWHNAGMQQMLDAVRATGATNVVLTSTLAYSGDLNGWLQYKPKDPANQLGAVWHAYSSSQYPTQVACVGLPTCSATMMVAAQAIKAAGYPVVITEYGDTIGGSTSPWASVLLPFADANNISYLGWTWDTWSGQTANDLITDAAGDPTQGYGTYVKAHYLCRAAGNAVCK